MSALLLGVFLLPIVWVVVALFAFLFGGFFEMYAGSLRQMAVRTLVVAACATIGVVLIELMFPSGTGGSGSAGVFSVGVPGLLAAVGWFFAFDGDFPDDLRLVIPFAVAMAVMLWWMVPALLIVVAMII